MVASYGDPRELPFGWDGPTHVIDYGQYHSVEPAMIVDPDVAARSLSDEDVERIAKRVAEMLGRVVDLREREHGKAR